MTIISASMLSGLTGSDPALIARAVELINNPALTSLNALWDGLVNGTRAVRVATAADNIGLADGQFLDPRFIG
ncbi:hypothetical protein [Variovorax sp. GT1P44]|uniref:hypothetical protein n=1 Tax=Variovorax sp. GT1P44 TaxID=3443742 RepID=UPI003F474589